MDSDPVEEHYKDLPYDCFGNVDLGEDINEEGTTRAEIEANLHDLIQDELVDSVIEYHMDGEIFHRHLDENDEECDWGEWRQVNYLRHSYDVQGR